MPYCGGNDSNVYSGGLCVGISHNNLWEKKTSKQVALPPFKTNPAFCQIIEGSVEWGVEKVHTDKNSSSWIPG